VPVQRGASIWHRSPGFASLAGYACRTGPPQYDIHISYALARDIRVFTCLTPVLALRYRLCQNPQMIEARMEEILAQLNPAQREAVEAPDGPTLVVARPGRGKTRVLTHRVLYLIKHRGIRPHRIMAVTFTNKAALEMKERLHALLGPEIVRQITIGMFHAICVRILRREAKHLPHDRGYLSPE